MPSQPTRRPARLPQRVYWFRRGLVLAVAAALVLGIGTLLGGFSSDGDPAQANVTSANQTTGATPSTTRAPLGPAVPEKIKTKASATPLLAPTGECEADAVSVLPSVPVAVAGKPITVHLRLEGTQPACTFEVSPESLVVKITSGEDPIWTSQDCPHAVKKSTVVVRSGTPTDVPIVWSARRSDDDCSASTGWAMPGFYHVYTAALGSTPADVQFEVTYPKRGFVTKVAKPKKKATTSASPTASPRPTKAPAPSPSAGVSGKQSKCGGDNSASSC